VGYRCEATSVAGFLQQLAVGYLARGYFFYVMGTIPEDKDLRAVDAKLISKYGIAVGKSTRSRRKAAGFANVQYLRYRRNFVLLATHGSHAFFEEEGALVRDAREVPIKFEGYAVSHRAGHPHVRIEQGRYLEFKAYVSELSVHRSKETLEKVFRSLRYEPYAPVRSQLFCILRAVNRRRKLAQYEPVSPACIRSRRQVVKPFEGELSCVPRCDTPGQEGAQSPTLA
jgi:hypothetical protein